jgi:hypothetical protein
MNSEELLKKLVSETKMMSQPIDFAALESRGVISKAGAWYRLHKPHDLPEHASKKIYELAQDAKGLKVKFSKASRFEKMAKRFEQIAAKKGLSG